MNKHFILTVIVLLTLTSLCFGQNDNSKKVKHKTNKTKMVLADKDIIDREIGLWEIVKNKQIDLFRKFHADNFVAVHSDGASTLDQMASGIKDLELKSFSLTEPKVVLSNKHTAVLTYKVVVQGNYKGTDISGAYYSSSVWVNKGGNWVAILYNEIKAG